jgi:hypothetical protein
MIRRWRQDERTHVRGRSEAGRRQVGGRSETGRRQVGGRSEEFH